MDDSDFGDDDLRRAEAMLEEAQPGQRNVWGELLRARAVVRIVRSYVEGAEDAAELLEHTIVIYQEYMERPGNAPGIFFEL